jgi:hypothetical protein
MGGRGKMRLALVVLAYVLSTSSSAQWQLGDQRCKQLDFVAAQIDTVLLSSLQTIGEAVEKVPPTEAKYIREEKELALQQNNAARFRLIRANRFYFPLTFHDDFEVADQNMRAARSAKDGKNVARHLVIVLARLRDLSESMKDYMEFDHWRQPILSEEKQKEMFFLLPLIKDQTTSLLQCVISQLEQ